MARKTDRQLIVGLDIGTSKVVALVGEIAEDGSIELIGIGTQPSRGLKRGMVVTSSRPRSRSSVRSRKPN